MNFEKKVKGLDHFRNFRDSISFSRWVMVMAIISGKYKGQVKLDED